MMSKSVMISKRDIPGTEHFGYSAARSDILATVTALATPKPFVNKNPSRTVKKYHLH